ncbi:MAG: hypothetical protein ACYCTV_10700 [Leptospirales bacterium]
MRTDDTNCSPHPDQKPERVPASREAFAETPAISPAVSRTFALTRRSSQSLTFRSQFSVGLRTGSFQKGFDQGAVALEKLHSKGVHLRRGGNKKRGGVNRPSMTRWGKLEGCRSPCH